VFGLASTQVTFDLAYVCLVLITIQIELGCFDVTGAPVNRSGVCPDFEGAIDLSDRGITSLPPGAFENCGKPT